MSDLQLLLWHATFPIWWARVQYRIWIFGVWWPSGIRLSTARVAWFMMNSSNGYIFCVTGHLCGEFTGHKGQWRGALMFSLICTRINGWVSNSEAGDLRHNCARYDVTVMFPNKNTLIDLRTAQVYCVAIFLTCWHPSHITISFLL